MREVIMENLEGREWLLIEAWKMETITNHIHLKFVHVINIIRKGLNFDKDFKAQYLQTFFFQEKNVY
jgi:hypothetical protein